MKPSVTWIPNLAGLQGAPLRQSPDRWGRGDEQSVRRGFLAGGVAAEASFHDRVTVSLRNFVQVRPIDQEFGRSTTPAPTASYHYAIQ